MRRLLGRWKVRHLVTSWVAYWTVAAAIALAPGVVAVWQVSRPGVHGDATAGITDGMLKVTVTAGGSTLWSSSISVAVLCLAIAGPPILMWAAWMAAASAERRRAAEPAQLRGAGDIPWRREERDAYSSRNR